MDNKKEIDSILNTIVFIEGEKEDTLQKALMQLAKKKDKWFLSLLSLIRGELYRIKDNEDKISFKDADEIILQIGKKLIKKD